MLIIIYPLYIFYSFAFLTFADPATTKLAFKKMNNANVAKRVYSAYYLSEFVEIQGLSEEYQPPEIHPFVETVSYHCHSY